MAVDDSYTKSLLHFDGADASTTFTDGSGKTWTTYGNSQLDTSVASPLTNGNSTGLFDGAGDYIDTPDNADFDIGSGDFTVDFWVKRAATGAQWICGQSDSSATTSSLSISLDFLLGGQMRFQIWSATNYNAQSTTSFGTSTWYHVAGVRYGNTLTNYVDGIAEGTSNVTGVTVNNSANKWAIGRLGEYNAAALNGRVEEFRFSKGIARWTANFTPPTLAYGSGWSNISKVNGIASSSIGKVNGIEIATLSKVNGVST